MIVTNVKLQRTAQRLPRRIAAAAALFSSALLAALAVPATARAENILQDVSYAATGGGRVDVVLELAGPAPDAQVIDSTSLTPEEVVAHILQWLEQVGVIAKRAKE